MEILSITVENEETNGGSYAVGKYVSSILHVVSFSMNLFRVRFVEGSPWDDGEDVLVNADKVVQIKIKSEGS